MSDDEKIKSMVETWRKLFNEKITWVMFKNGTSIVFDNPVGDLEKLSMEFIEKWGPVVPGTPSGDFTVKYIDDFPGWVILYHQPGILNYVGPDEIELDDDDPMKDVTIGMIGRQKRVDDSKSLNIVHIEDKRS